MDLENKKKFQTELCNFLPMGSDVDGNHLHFSINTAQKIDKVILFRRGTQEIAGYAEINESMHFGNLYAFRIKNAKRYDYAIMSGNCFVKDEYAKSVNRYEIKKQSEHVTGMDEIQKDEGCANPAQMTQGIKEDEEMKTEPEYLETYTPYIDNFDWEDDRRIFHPYEESVFYRLHVRGFTKDNSSRVKNKGCYAGVVEKIPYMKELGITTVELMPAYEYEEVITEGAAKGKTNYWGYGPANYFAPKERFSKKGKGSQINEFKYMVKELHKNNIEVIMEFYFVPEMNPHVIMDVLRFWVLEYHIDGIHVNLGIAPLNMIKSDPLLSMVKIISNYDTGEDIQGYHKYKGQKRFAIMDDGFMMNARRFLKSDDDQINGMMERIKRNPSQYALIYSLANYNTLSLMDSVSYDIKHNEANGEDNRDGSDYNFSWNCGVEGYSRRKKVVELRKQQIKNAIIMMMVSQGTPLIYAGDEMGKSYRGNNNPYCQDNETSWLNWRDLNINSDIFEFFKEMIAFRKANKVLHREEEPRLTDYKGLGCPDLSYHGTQPWQVDQYYANRSFACMYHGGYGEAGDPDLYIAFNMNWHEKEFAVPYIDKHKKWEVQFFTEKQQKIENVERMVTLPPRTVCVLKSVEVKKQTEILNESVHTKAPQVRRKRKE